MDDFLPRENIKRFEKQLKGSIDEHQRKVLNDLLAAERQRLNGMHKPQV